MLENAKDSSKEAEEEYLPSFLSESDHDMSQTMRVEEVVVVCCYHLDAASWAIDLM